MHTFTHDFNEMSDAKAFEQAIISLFGAETTKTYKWKGKYRFSYRKITEERCTELVNMVQTFYVGKAQGKI